MRVLDPLKDGAWDRMIAQHPDAGCFHTSAWARVLRQTYDHAPFYLQFSRGGRLAALVPLMEVRSRLTGCRGVCLPFSDVCEPLFFDRQTIDTVKNQIATLARQRRWKHVEVRGGLSFQLSAEPAAQFHGHTLDLRQSAEQLFASFASAVRRAIRKAERSGVRACIDHHRQGIVDFYRLHVRTRRRQGLPPQPFAFFANIYEHIIKPGLGFIIVARHNSKPIAAAVFFRFAGNAIYKYGASDKRIQEIRANNLVIWRGIQLLADSGATTLHFGRTARENDGLRRFKLSWNTTEEIIPYFRADPSGARSFLAADYHSGFHKKVFGKLPLMLNRLAGSLIYPHLD